jgi:hypothetical protein
LRGVAITGVVVQNFLSSTPVDCSTLATSSLKYIAFFGSSLLHIFFFLSGYGLTQKYIHFGKFPWKKYFINRFSMIVVPYWILLLVTFILIEILHAINPAVFTFNYNVTDLFYNIVLINVLNKSALQLNPTLYFMHAICGLYIAFPFLLNILKQRSLIFFLLTSAILSYLARYIWLILGFEISRESSIFIIYILEFAVGMAFSRIPENRLNIIKSDSINFFYLIVVLLGYTISYALKIKYAIMGNLHDIFTYLGSVAFGILSYQVLRCLKLGKIEKFFAYIGTLAFIIFLIHNPLIRNLISPIIKNYGKNFPGIAGALALFACYFFLLVLMSDKLIVYFKALSIKIEEKLNITVA